MIVRHEHRDWDEWERAELVKRLRSFQSLGMDALQAAVESSVHWNRMYAETMEDQRNDIRDSRAENKTE